jgi:hypothetical protein
MEVINPVRLNFFPNNIQAYFVPYREHIASPLKKVSETVAIYYVNDIKNKYIVGRMQSLL